MRADIYPAMVRQNAPERLQRLAQDGGKAHERERLKEAATEFEALMVEQMIREMRKNVPESGLFGKSHGRELFEEMLDGEYSRHIAGHGGLGLADVMVRQLEPQGPAKTDAGAQVSASPADGVTKRADSGR